MFYVTDLSRRRPSRQLTARLALRRTQQAVLETARELGEASVKRPVFRDRPDLGMTVDDVEPLLGASVTARLKGAAHLLSLDYVRYAREDGHSWQEIAEA